MGRDADVDDLVQDAFVAAFTTLGRLEKPDAFASWIGGILVRQAYKLIRRRKLLARLGLRGGGEPIDLDTIVSPSASPDRAAELRAIYAALGAMDADVRVPLVLHRVEGASLEEVADMTGMSLATVKRRIAAADALLRARFDGGAS
jgi:RNA polymerase sigma-70 factor (ECF subfamily)